MRESEYWKNCLASRHRGAGERVLEELSRIEAKENESCRTTSD